MFWTYTNTTYIHIFLFIWGSNAVVSSYHSWLKSHLWFWQRRPKSRMLSSNVIASIREQACDQWLHHHSGYISAWQHQPYKQGTSFRQFLLTSKDSFPNAGEHPRSIPRKKTLVHPKANHVTPKGFCHVLTQHVQRRDGKAGYYISEKAVCIGNSNTALCR